jgi:hypothetical protein
MKDGFEICITIMEPHSPEVRMPPLATKELAETLAGIASRHFRRRCSQEYSDAKGGVPRGKRIEIGFEMSSQGRFIQ